MCLCVFAFFLNWRSSWASGIGLLQESFELEDFRDFRVAGFQGLGFQGSGLMMQSFRDEVPKQMSCTAPTRFLVHRSPTKPLVIYT